MAELHIERKERTAWPWIIAGIALLALLVWFLFARSGADGTVAQTDTAGVMDSAAGAMSPGDGTMPAAIGDFVRYTEDNVADNATQAHDYTSNGLRRLADALAAVTDSAVSGIDIGQRIQAIRDRADELQRDPNSTQHAREAREAFLLVSALMGHLQQASYPSLSGEVSNVDSAARAMQPDAPLLDQRAEVQQFFSRASTALQAMSRARG